MVSAELTDGRRRRQSHGGEFLLKNDVTWRTVANFGSAVEAQFAVDLLQDHGLQARVPDEELGGLVPGLLTWEGGPRLQVPVEQADDARRVLRLAEQSSEFPSPDHQDVSASGFDWLAVLAGALLFLLVGFVVVKQVF